MKNALILLSGGLDSATTLYYVKNKLKPKKIICLFIDYGQLALKEEEYCSRNLSKKIKAKFKKINLKWLGDISQSLTNKKGKIPKTDPRNIVKEKKQLLRWWVPSRNTIFLAAALAHAESKFLSKKEKYEIYIGLKHEGKVPMKDTTKEFIQEFNKLAIHSTHHGKYKIIAPLIDLDKDEIVKLAHSLNVPIESTYSCYIGSKFIKNKLIHCGTCSNCIQRKQAFYWANIKDPTSYKNI